MLCLLVKPQEESKLTSKQTKNHLELPENQTVWKSNNQGFKEAIFIQMGMRHGEHAVWHQRSSGGSRKGSPTFMCGG